MTSDNVTATEYVTKSLTDNANAKVYYKIKAIDKRDNTSLLSDQALLILPDVSGPSRPVLSHPCWRKFVTCALYSIAINN